MVGRLFGPIMVLWFVVLAVLGVWHIVQSPNVIVALNPYYAFSFMAAHVLQAYIVLGSVVLVLTGAEALYADMGHFGAKPIRYGWYVLVMPSLVLNYFGQGALLMHRPEGDRKPVLPAGAGLGAAAARGPVDGGDRDRVAGGDFRRLFADEPGHPARLRAAHEDPAYVGSGDRADLYAGGELDAAVHHPVHRDRLQELGEPRRRVRYRGDGDHGDHHHSRVGGDGEAVGMEQAAGGR